MNGCIVKIDSRGEPDIKFDGALCFTTPLDYGDLEITTPAGETICIERKTPSDLLGSIADNRLFNQIAGMREKTPHVFLVITGTLYRKDDKVQVSGRETGWVWSSVQGALMTVQELGGVIVYCKSDEYADTIERIVGRNRGEKIIHPAASPKFISDGEKILSSLPGIGPQRAISMLEEFSQPYQCLTWLTWMNTPATVAGIGDGTKARVRKALGLTNDQELDIQYKENGI